MSNKNSKNHSILTSTEYVDHTTFNIRQNVSANDDSVALSGLGTIRTDKVKIKPGVYKHVEAIWVSEAQQYIMNIIIEANGEIVHRSKIGRGTEKPQYVVNAIFDICDQLQK
jgi:hypothetical protein